MSLLAEARDRFGVSAVKASMEAEGVSLPELARTKDITAAAGVGFSVKIGGCEALTDARLARDLGATSIMAPMIESRFALEKFLAMMDAVFPHADGPSRCINIETRDGCDRIEDILSAPGINRLTGIVLGRTDLSAALGQPDVEAAPVLEAARGVFCAAREKGIACLVGGGLSARTVAFIEDLGGLVTGFETRKVVFDSLPGDPNMSAAAIREALRFELLWYQSRRERYAPLAAEDDGRIRKLQESLSEKLAGTPAESSSEMPSKTFGAFAAMAGPGKTVPAESGHIHNNPQARPA